MEEDYLITSFHVNRNSNLSCGLPFCAPVNSIFLENFFIQGFAFQGKQAEVEVPVFYPDRARPYVAESEAKLLFDRFNVISRRTGVPFCPLMLIPFILFILVAIIISLSFPTSVGFMVIGVVVPPLSFFGIIGLIIFLSAKRKGELTNLIDEWNRTVGIPKGIYFAFGTGNGVSTDDFFNIRRGFGNFK